MKILQLYPKGRCFDQFSKDFLQKLERSNYDFDIMQLYIDGLLVLTIPKHKLLVITELGMEPALLSTLCKTNNVYDLSY